MSRPTMTVLALLLLLFGFTACAKYPVVVDMSAPAPGATSQAPTR